ncbi:helix-turn-helix domain-containing protein [Paraclostridium tenue]
MNTINFDDLTKTKVELNPNSILKNGYGLISQEIMRNKNISVQAKAIYSYLCSMAGNDGIAYPTQALMIDELDMNKTTFNKYLKEILSSGYIKVTQTRKNGKAYKNVYTITMDKRDIEPNRKAYVKIAIENKKKKPSNQVNNLPSQCLKIYDIDNQCHKKQVIEIYDSKSNRSKSNIVVDDETIATNENKVIDLYKSFKLEKRVTPHMTKLLKQYANKLDLKIFEDIFINTLEKKPDSNFRYIRSILESLISKRITKFDHYKLDMEQYRKNNCSKRNIKSSRNNIKNTTKQSNSILNSKVHNFDGSANFMKYDPDELERMLLENSKNKFK